MKNIGEILKDRGIISKQNLDEAYRVSPENLVEGLIKLGYLTMDTLIMYLDYELKIKRDY